MQILLAVEITNEFRSNERSISRTAEHKESMHNVRRRGSREAFPDQIRGCSAKINSSALGIMLHLLQNVIINGQCGAHFRSMMPLNKFDVKMKVRASLGVLR